MRARSIRILIGMAAAGAVALGGLTAGLHSASVPGAHSRISADSAWGPSKAAAPAL